MDIVLRGLQTADIPAWTRLLAAIEERDRTDEHYNEADLAEEMANPDIELGKDIVGAFDGGALVGCYSVYGRPAVTDVHKIHLGGGVHPDLRGRGIGTTLATAMLARAREVHLEHHPEVPALLTLAGLSDNAEQASLMKLVGLVPDRWTFAMRAHLSRRLLTPGSAPAGLELRRYDDSLSGPILAAHNAAFVDHPNFTPWSETMWKQWVTESRSFRPGLSFVLADPARSGEVAAYVQTNEYDALEQSTGRREAYVAKVGTRREYRRRGLATTLLAHAVLEYRNAGFDTASLHVDSENPTGALGIYERTGFAVVTRFSDYVGRLSASHSAQG